MRTSSSCSSINVMLPSGNRAVYLMPPAAVGEFVGPARRTPPSPSSQAAAYGHQVAHEHGGWWYRPGGWERIVDAATLSSIAAAREVLS